MGKTIQLSAQDGHTLEAYLAEPEGEVQAGLVILQEAFGLTDHMCRVTDGFAEQGYLAIAPALFDRAQPGIRLAYTEVQKGRDVIMDLDLDNVVLDMSAATAAARERTGAKVGTVGYCWGGALADLAACKCGLDAAVAYYGGRASAWLELKPTCPVLYHFGELDPLIPPEVVGQIRDGRSDGVFHVYPQAGHGFNCDERDDFHPESAALALERTLTFLGEHLRV